jgi:Family of unknown function (DUF6370)
MKKKSLIALLAIFQAMALMIPAFAAGKEVTITGEGMCAKCALHETAKCQNAIQTEVDGKKVTYYLAQNAVSKDFHHNLCKENQKVTATGTVKEVNGKRVLTASKIELAK